MPSNALDAYGLMIAAINDPNPVLGAAAQGACCASKDTRLIPGEPADDEELSRMIDAPIGDRSNWKPQWPDLQEYIVPIGDGRTGPRGDRRHGHQLRPAAAAVRAGRGRTGPRARPDAST